jgi:D-alanyl-lipoteichoic acid acyltransferase DltB (MBOAT superfamily)
MLFNSFVFLFCFLPAVYLGHRLLLASGRYHPAIGFVALASFFFYGWWSLGMLPLFLGSIVANFGLGAAIRKARAAEATPRADALLWIGIILNLGMLCYFKYLGFFADNFRAITGIDLGIPRVILPIGISFYTFVQIAYLVDHWRKPIPDASFSRYAVFVSFFPHLIAGPIIHHRDVMPQFDAPAFRKPPFGMVSAGLAMLAVGLFKKSAIADNLAPVASALFDSPSMGNPRALESWVGVLAYTMQIYFDFSGYSDMAVGLGYLFGIKLPVNFWSPYQAASPIDFWRRWHMTLSQFLRDYLYIPLGGNRSGRLLRYRNLFLTMLLGGLWHGANWTYVVWGALHGALLAANHCWNEFKPRWWPSFGVAGPVAGRIGTFAFVAMAWVFFRAESVGAAWRVLGALGGGAGAGFPKKPGLEAWLKAAELEPTQASFLIAALLLAFFAPNSGRMLLGMAMDAKGRVIASEPGASRLRFSPSWAWAIITGVLFFSALWFSPEVSEFIYFQF